MRLGKNVTMTIAIKDTDLLLTNLKVWLPNRAEQYHQVVPFSGGLDSSTALLLCHTFSGGVVTPVRANTASEIERSKGDLILGQLGLTATEVDIAKILAEGKKIVRSAIGAERTPAVTVENSIISWVCLEIARQQGALFIGTLDLTEILLGYFPKDSDQGDVMPLAGMFRSEVKSIGRRLGYHYEEAIRLVPGCGHLVDYVEEMSEIRFASEEDIDLTLQEVLNGNTTDSKTQALAALVAQMTYKSRGIFWGKSIFWGDQQRKVVLRELVGDFT